MYSTYAHTFGAVWTMCHMPKNDEFVSSHECIPCVCVWIYIAACNREKWVD